LAKRIPTSLGAKACFNYITNASGCSDDNGHGTVVAGIIAADGSNTSGGTYGVAPGAQLYVYKVCDSNGSCYADDIAAAINAAAQNGVKVVNMSFGATVSYTQEENAISAAADKGILLVGAAGNSPNSNLCTSVNYPASFAR